MYTKLTADGSRALSLQLYVAAYNENMHFLMLSLQLNGSSLAIHNLISSVTLAGHTITDLFNLAGMLNEKSVIHINYVEGQNAPARLLSDGR